MMEYSIRKMTCVVCPVGCRMEAQIDENGAVTAVTGNTCPRGKAYALSEIANPVRTLTTTVKLQNAKEAMLPVKTSQPIPKPALLEAMRQIKTITLSPPIQTCTIILKNFIQPGINLVACKTVEK